MKTGDKPLALPKRQSVGRGEGPHLLCLSPSEPRAYQFPSLSQVTSHSQCINWTFAEAFKYRERKEILKCSGEVYKTMTSTYNMSIPVYFQNAEHDPKHHRVFQRHSLPGSVPGQAGWGFKQSDLVNDVSAHGSGVGWSLSSSPTQTILRLHRHIAQALYETSSCTWKLKFLSICLVFNFIFLHCCNYWRWLFGLCVHRWLHVNHKCGISTMLVSKRAQFCRASQTPGSTRQLWKHFRNKQDMCCTNTSVPWGEEAALLNSNSYLELTQTEDLWGHRLSPDKNVLALLPLPQGQHWCY